MSYFNANAGNVDASVSTDDKSARSSTPTLSTKSKYCEAAALSTLWLSSMIALTTFVVAAYTRSFDRSNERVFINSLRCCGCSTLGRCSLTLVESAGFDNVVDALDVLAWKLPDNGPSLEPPISFMSLFVCDKVIKLNRSFWREWKKQQQQQHKNRPFRAMWRNNFCST